MTPVGLVFVDTSAWYAVTDKSDANHESAIDCLNTITEPLITTNFIVNETITLIRKHLGFEQASKIGHKFWKEEITKLVQVTQIDETEAWKVFLKYKDKDFSFTDCISFVIMTRLNISKAFTFDCHFKQYGKFTVIP